MTQPIVTKKEVPSTLIITTYTCPTCGNSSDSQKNILYCIKSHTPKPDQKFKIGDCVKFFHYPEDYREYATGIVKTVKFIPERNYDHKIKNYIDEYVYDIETNDDIIFGISESSITELLVNMETRQKQLDHLTKILVTLPDTLQWEIIWSNDSSKYHIKGNAK